jgi:hypothetical protein
MLILTPVQHRNDRLAKYCARAAPGSTLPSSRGGSLSRKVNGHAPRFLATPQRTDPGHKAEVYAQLELGLTFDTERRNVAAEMRPGPCTKRSAREGVDDRRNRFAQLSDGAPERWAGDPGAADRHAAKRHHLSRIGCAGSRES